MSMHINLSDEMEQYLKAKVASGYYGNATEVIRDAIRRMQVQEQQVAALQAAVALGDAQLAQGQGIPYSEAVLGQLTERALKNLRSGQPIDPNVLP